MAAPINQTTTGQAAPPPVTQLPPAAPFFNAPANNNIAPVVNNFHFGNQANHAQVSRRSRAQMMGRVSGWNRAQPKFRPPPPTLSQAATPLSQTPIITHTNEMRQAVVWHQKLDEACKQLENLATASTNDTVSAQEVLKVTATIKTNAAGLRKYFATFHKSVSSTRSHARKGRAKKAFQAPELLEAVLSCLDIPGLLKAQQVCKHFKSVIDESATLQRRLGLRAADADSFFELPLHGVVMTGQPYRGLFGGAAITFNVTGPFDMAGQSFLTSAFNMGPSGSHDTTEATIVEEACVSVAVRPFKGDRLPNVGSRIAAMLVCQPPVKELTFSSSCCVPTGLLGGQRIYGNRTAAPADYPKLVNENGITVGDILTQAHKMIAEHRLCPNATEQMLDRHGYVQLQLTFHAKVPLVAKDPLVVQAKMAKAKVEKSQAKEEQRILRLMDYHAAKQEARINGTPIPTLAEFEAAEMAKPFEERGESFQTAGDRDNNDDDDDDDDEYYDKRNALTSFMW